MLNKTNLLLLYKMSLIRLFDQEMVKYMGHICDRSVELLVIHVRVVFVEILMQHFQQPTV